jgi:hypothetical protein
MVAVWLGAAILAVVTKQWLWVALAIITAIAYAVAYRRADSDSTANRNDSASHPG